MMGAVWARLAVLLPGDKVLHMDVTGADVRAWESASGRSWFADPVMTATQAMDMGRMKCRAAGLWSGTDQEWDEVAMAWPTAQEPPDPTSPAPSDGQPSG